MNQATSPFRYFHSSPEIIRLAVRRTDNARRRHRQRSRDRRGAYAGRRYGGHGHALHRNAGIRRRPRSQTDADRRRWRASSSNRWWRPGSIRTISHVPWDRTAPISLQRSNLGKRFGATAIPPRWSMICRQWKILSSGWKAKQRKPAPTRPGASDWSGWRCQMKCTGRQSERPP